MATIKPIWTYGIDLWGTASNSNIAEVHNMELRTVVNAPWSSRSVIENDLKMSSVPQETKRLLTKYNNRLTVHPNK